MLFTASALWLGSYNDRQTVPFIPFEGDEWYNPYFQGFVVFFTYIIIYQVSVVHVYFYIHIRFHLSYAVLYKYYKCENTRSSLAGVRSAAFKNDC